MRPVNRSRTALVALISGGCTALAGTALARPNTHAPAISTWDTRASTVVLGIGRGVSGSGEFTRLSYNANFSSTTGLLSAQFGVHYLTYRDQKDSVLARGASAGGVAMFNFPIASRFSNGVPRSSFDVYVGGVPTALISGQLNFISVPMVLGAGVPVSPVPWLSIEPWVELSPGINFDTRIEEISTAEAVQSAMDGTLTRAEVEDLVKQGLKITQETTLGKRAGLSVTGHLGERVDLSAHLAIGAGHTGSASLGASLVVRWDSMVVGATAPPSSREAAARESDPAETEVPGVCRQWQAGLRRCMATPPRRRAAQPLQAPSTVQPAGRRRPGTKRAPASVQPSVAQPSQPAVAQPTVAQPAASARPVQKKSPPQPVTAPPSGAKAPAPALPPLQAAPPVSR
ncbi:MAG: hypothetical protein RL033_6562 [Pseudomonadota bacterium]